MNAWHLLANLVGISQRIFSSNSLSKTRTQAVKEQSTIIVQGMHWLPQSWTLGIALVLGIGGAIVTECDRTLAQLTPDTAPDRTLGTTVTPFNPQIDLITGGTQPNNGPNLFHSFSDFNVGAGRGVYFVELPGVINILSRVTGNQPSNILGVLGVVNNTLSATGTANLFLINPNGIIFGPNAQLDLGGSFVASTANSINFADGTQFSATTPQAAPLLTVSVPLGLQYGSDPGNIQVQESTLKVDTSQTLALVGGNVSIDNGKLIAPGGRVELGGIAQNGTVNLSVGSIGNSPPSLSFPPSVARADVSLTNQALVDVASVGNGDIAINARNINISDSIFCAGIGTSCTGSDVEDAPQDDSVAGNIIFNATEVISIRESWIGNNVSNASGSSDQTFASNNWWNSEEVLSALTDNTIFGSIIIKAGSFELTKSTLTTDSDGSRNAGLIAVLANGGVAVEDSKLYSSGFNNGESDSGNILIEAGSISLKKTFFDTTSFNSGSPGSIIISASNQDLSISDTKITSENANPSDSDNSLNYGSIQLEATAGSVSLNSSILSTTNDKFGDAGYISINASDQISITNSEISSKGDSGYIEIGSFASDSSVSPTQVTIDKSKLTTDSRGAGFAGYISINASDQISIANSQIFSNGNFGYIAIGTFTDDNSVSPRTVTINKSTLSTNNQVGDQAGNSNQPSQAGYIDIASSDSIELYNDTQISAETLNGSQNSSNTPNGSKEGGNIYLNSPLVLLRQGSNISANAKGTDSNGGNIYIDTTFLVAVPKENSDITADSANGRGGNVEVNATDGGIYGIQFRDQRTPRSDITASGQESGTVIFYTSGIDPEKGLAELPVTVSDPSNQIVTGCAAARGNSFTVTGRGGIPEDPTATIRGQTVWRDLQDFSQGTETGQASSPNPQALTTSRKPRLVEANSWKYDEKGNVVLVAVEGNGTSSTYRTKPPECQDLSSVSAPKN